jgi:hypothetical protein
MTEPIAAVDERVILPTPLPLCARSERQFGSAPFHAKQQRCGAGFEPATFGLCGTGSF